MQKIALYSLLVCLGPSFVYGAECNRPSTFSPSNNNWNAGANEYLFATKKEYNKAINTGYIYECDSDWCGNNTYVELPAGHVFGGATVNSKAYYKCTLHTAFDWDDYWTKVSSVSGLTKCTKQWSWTKDGIDSKLMDAEANEYLYATQEDYEATKGRLYGQVYECDSSAKTCNYGDTLTLKSGHVFQRKTINEKRTYKCVSGDFWLDITDDIQDNKPTTQTTPTNKCTVNGKTYNIGDKIKPDFDCSSLKGKSSSISLSFLSEITSNYTSMLATGEKCSTVCAKYSSGAVYSGTFIKKCPSNTTGVPSTIIAPSGYYTLCKENKPSWKPCKEQFKNPSEERCACWDAKGDTTWTGNEQTGTCTCNDKDFDWDAKEKKCIKRQPSNCDDYYDNYLKYTCCKLQEQGITEFNKTTGSCKCKKDGAKWDEENGQCIEQTSTDNGSGTVEVGPCEYIYKGYIDCPPYGQFSSNNHKKTLQPNQLEGLSCSEFNSVYGKDANYARQYFAEWCVSYTNTNIPNKTSIDNAQAKLRALKSEASVWKNAEGKFNTARLASDMTAGVVLGTVGGVVSGVVIKKKQLEKGFDVLHCSVGGQVVADWGDEFKVVGSNKKQ